MIWAIKWTSENKRDGKREMLMFPKWEHSLPDYYSGRSIALFETRALARQYIKDNYGYIKTRPDLRAEPHGWRVPVPVKVTVDIKEVEE